MISSFGHFFGMKPFFLSFYNKIANLGRAIFMVLFLYSWKKNAQKRFQLFKKLNQRTNAMIKILLRQTN